MRQGSVASDAQGGAVAASVRDPPQKEAGHYEEQRLQPSSSPSPPLSPPSHSDNKKSDSDNNNGKNKLENNKNDNNSPWREYLDRIVHLCRTSTSNTTTRTCTTATNAGPPSPTQLLPPTSLLSSCSAPRQYQKQQRRPHGATASSSSVLLGEQTGTVPRHDLLRNTTLPIHATAEPASAQAAVGGEIESVRGNADEITQSTSAPACSINNDGKKPACAALESLSVHSNNSSIVAAAATTETTVSKESGAVNGIDNRPLSGSSEETSDAAIVSTSTSTSEQILILLDMNGTLLYRAKRPLPLPAGTEDFVHGDPEPLQYYIRPGASEMVGAIARHPRSRVAFYTSMRGVNALPAARFLLPDDCRASSGDPDVYDRPFNAHDPEGTNHWDTTRDLPLIWSTPGRAGTGFGPHNTVMVDDTPKKMRYMNAGLVVVPEYNEACVLAACGRGAAEGEHPASEQAKVMPRLENYMCRLLDESGDDVRPFLQRNLFQPHDSDGHDDMLILESSTTTPLEEKTTLDVATATIISTATDEPTAAERRPTVSVAPVVNRGQQQQQQQQRQVLTLADAVELVLATRPLACHALDSPSHGSCCEAFCKVPRILPLSGKGVQASPPPEDPAAPQALCCSLQGGIFGRGEDRGGELKFDRHVMSNDGIFNNSTVVDVGTLSAVRELLEEACLAAELWGLGDEEKRRLKRCLDVAGATSARRAE